MAEVIGQVYPLGAVLVNWAGVDMGLTTPKSTVTFKTAFVEAESGAYGKTPIRVFRNGTRVEVDLEFQQNDLANVVGPSYQQFTVVSGAGKTKLTFGQIAGLANTNDVLILTSVVSANTPGVDLTLTQATPVGDPKLMYNAEGVQVYAAKFVACIDLGQVAGAFLGSFGDNSATQDDVAPTVSSVVPAADATGVSVGTSVIWTLSKNLNGGTVNGNSVKLFLPANEPNGEVACAAPVLVNNGASTTITLTPLAPLTTASNYLAVLTTQIKDQFGNPLAATYTSDFITES